MGEASRKRARLEAQRKELESAVEKVSHALIRLATAASAGVGSDCYPHAELGRILLGDLGFDFQTRVGFAAWRIGPQDGDVLSHTLHNKGYLPPGAEVGFAYHAWLETADWLVDFTTYQLRHKARELDAADGGHTLVEWCPAYLLLSRDQVRTYREVAMAPGPGLAYYEASDELTRRMAQGHQIHDEDVAYARLILANPQVVVMGLNTLVQP